MQTTDTQESPTPMVYSQMSQTSEGGDAKTKTQQQLQHSSKKLVVLVITVVLIFLLIGVGVFVLIARQKTLPIPLPSVLQPGRELEGAWKLAQGFMKDPKTGQFAPMQFPGEGASYIEFRGDTVCSEGTFDTNGAPRPCRNFTKYALTADTITIPQGGQSSFTGKWKVAQNKLEITITAFGEQPVEARWVLVKITPAQLPIPPSLKQVAQDSLDDPRELIGLWEFEQYVKKEGDKEERSFSGALELKENTYCSRWQFTNQTSEFICNEYASYTVQGNIIKFGTGPGEPWNPARWNIVNGKLTLEDASQSLLPIKVFKKIR